MSAEYIIYDEEGLE